MLGSNEQIAEASQIVAGVLDPDDQSIFSQRESSSSAMRYTPSPGRTLDPGNVRARLAPSTGLVRVPGANAGGLATDTTLTWPRSAETSRSRQTAAAAATPSYSSPWTPPRTTTCGPPAWPRATSSGSSSGPASAPPGPTSVLASLP